MTDREQTVYHLAVTEEELKVVQEALNHYMGQLLYFTRPDSELLGHICHVLARAKDMVDRNGE